MNNNKSKHALLSGALALMGTMLTPAVSTAADGESVLQQKCLTCHTRTGNPEAPYSRISQQRKTPEGWQMTINRMQRLNGLVISGEEMQAVIKYLRYPGSGTVRNCTIPLRAGAKAKRG